MLSFLAVLWGLALMRSRRARSRAHKGMLDGADGRIRYIQGPAGPANAGAAGAGPMIFGMPYMTMLTVFASDVL